MAITVLNAFVLQVQKILFVTWTAMKTYINGPYYSYLELNRNYELFGKVRKLTPEDSDIASNLEGKVCVITGGSRGIGKQVVNILLKKGCRVITGSSSDGEQIEKRHKEITEQLGEQNKGTLEIWPLDLSSMDSVMQFIDRVKSTVPSVNYLICNGGVMFNPFTLTKDGFESHMAINYLSHCLLVRHLTPLLVNSAKQTAQKSRIICVSSGLHRPGKIRINDLQSEKLFSTYHTYSQSKLAQIMFTYTFNEWLNNKEYSNFVNAYSLHPGVCRTDLMKAFNFYNIRPLQSLPIYRSAEEGSETIIYATLSTELENVSGVYLEDCCVTESSKRSRDKKMQIQLWQKTWELLKKWCANNCDDMNIANSDSTSAR